MENETKEVDLDLRKKAVIIGVAVLVLIIIIILLVAANKSKNTTKTTVGNKTQTSTEATSKPVVTSEDKPTTTVDKFRSEVPVNIIVPDQNTKLTDTEKKVTAIPTVVAAAAPGVEAKFRSFDVKADGGVFTPSKIIANTGDTVHINFTAVDKDYDITFPSYSMKQTAKKGQTKVLEFQAVEVGSFLYYCDACGGETSSAKGSIIVAK